MIKVGIVGFGFMGTMHFRCYQSNDSAKVVALCDVDQRKFSGGATAGNIGDSKSPLNLNEIMLFEDFGAMLSRTELDAVSITLPTYMHRQFTIMALEAGVSVLCEKPMALDLRQCEDMVAAAEESGKILQIGHCIRFWPEYAKTKEIIDSGEYGKVIAASFRRLSATPTWSWKNWLMDKRKSGGAILDLHIHDADFVQYVFGMPKWVYTLRGPYGDFDHVVTQYGYHEEKAIVAEGGWVMAPGFGFEMSFNIVLESATIVFDSTREPAFKLFTTKSEEPIIPETKEGDGYSLEIAHFLDAVSGQQVPEIITPEQSLNSVKLVSFERESAEKKELIGVY